MSLFSQTGTERGMRLWTCSPDNKLILPQPKLVQNLFNAFFFFFFFKLLESERVIVSQLCDQPVAGLTQFKDAYFIGLIAKTKRNPKNPQNYI